MSCAVGLPSQEQTSVPCEHSVEQMPGTWGNIPRVNRALYGCDEEGSKNSYSETDFCIAIRINMLELSCSKL